jgi:predicted nucleic acid-binding protein
MPSYGIDTSVLVRLLTGEPAADFEATVSKLTALRATRTEPVLAANIVIA